MKSGNLIALGALAVGGYLLMASGSKKDDASESGGFAIPNIFPQSAAVSPTEAPIGSPTYNITFPDAPLAFTKKESLQSPPTVFKGFGGGASGGAQSGSSGFSGGWETPLQQMQRATVKAPSSAQLAKSSEIFKSPLPSTAIGITKKESSRSVSQTGFSGSGMSAGSVRSASGVYR